jgi:hypothetical protein
LPAEEVGLRGLARTAGPGRGDHHDVGFDQPGGDRRHHGEGRDGRVAAGDGDPGGTGEELALAGELGEAVGPGARVLAAVELLPGVGVGEPVVGPAVDDDHVVAELGSQLTRLAVGQGEEDDVVAGEGVGVGLVEHPVGQRHQVGLERAEGLARVGVPREGTDLYLWMAQQQPEDLAPGVPAGARHCDPLRRHVHDYTFLRMFMLGGSTPGSAPDKVPANW